jgi:hypothetical protein
MPILKQFGLMLLVPLKHETKGALRKLARDDTRGYVDRDIEVAVCGVKVRRIMLAVQDGDYDAEKPAYFRHGDSLDQLTVPQQGLAESPEPVAGARRSLVQHPGGGEPRRCMPA